MGPGLAIDGLEIAFEGVGTVVGVPAFALAPGSRVVIEGASGSGKTSLLHALAGLERPGAGRVRWGDVEPWALSAGARERWRRRSVGLVFQDIHLVDGLSALENVVFPVLFEMTRVEAPVRARAEALLAQLGIGAASRAITVMSRGERQRVALARALLFEPPLLFADEPTASLDRDSAADVARLLLHAAARTGATLVVTSHDPALLHHVPTRLRLEGGALAPAP